MGFVKFWITLYNAENGSSWLMLHLTAFLSMYLNDKVLEVCASGQSSFSSIKNVAPSHYSPHIIFLSSSATPFNYLGHSGTHGFFPHLVQLSVSFGSQNKQRLIP
jgi:hypothetical protein